MSNELSNRIEAYLQAAKGWVSADDLCAAFNVSKRDLRAHGDRPGLCSEFAISGNRDFRHVVHASPGEFESACRRMTSHAEGELARVKQLRRRRTKALFLDRPAPTVERRSDQTLLSLS